MTYRPDKGQLRVTDGRAPGAAPIVHRLAGPEAAIHEYCGPTYHSAGEVTAELERHGFLADQTEDALARMTSLGLLLEEDDLYLSLALPED